MIKKATIPTHSRKFLDSRLYPEWGVSSIREEGEPMSCPSSQPFTAQENAVIEQLMGVIVQHGLSADHAKELLGRTIQLLEWGKQSAPKLPEANA